MALGGAGAYHLFRHRSRYIIQWYGQIVIGTVLMLFHLFLPRTVLTFQIRFEGGVVLTFRFYPRIEAVVAAVPVIIRHCHTFSTDLSSQTENLFTASFSGPDAIGVGIDTHNRGDDDIAAVFQFLLAVDSVNSDKTLFFHVYEFS